MAARAGRVRAAARSRATRPAVASRGGSSSASTRRVTRADAKRRRSRLVLALAALFAAVMAAASFPLTSLITQHHQLSATQAQANVLTSENRALAAEARQLGDGAVVAGIARGDYGFVKPGQKAYDILPTSGSPLTSAINSGHVPLEGPPVAPGSAQSQALLDTGAGSASGARVGAAPTGARATGPAASPAAATQGSGLWGRVVHTLEFWR